MDAIALAISAGYRLSRTLVSAATKNLRVLRSQVSPLFRKFYSESLDRTTIVSRKYLRIAATTSGLSGIESENKMTRGTRITYTIGSSVVRRSMYAADRGPRGHFASCRATDQASKNFMARNGIWVHLAVIKRQRCKELSAANPPAPSRHLSSRGDRR